MSRYIVMYRYERSASHYDTHWKEFDDIDKAVVFAAVNDGIILKPVSYKVREIEE